MKPIARFARDWGRVTSILDISCNTGIFELSTGHYFPDWLRPTGARRAKARRCSFWVMPLLDTHVYIDGFNLFYGLLKGKPNKWLNLERFCDQLLPKNNVTKIYYFTAKVEARPQDPDQPARQLAYLNALSTLPRVEVHLGTFMTSVVSQVEIISDPETGRWLRKGGKPILKADGNGELVKAWVFKSEEKGSDVNLAAHLLRDAYRGNCKCAVVVSNDSDLLTPIRMAKADCDMIVGLVPPRPKGSIELKALADFKIDPRPHLLASAQFPETVQTSAGIVHKPADW